jgi:hypothetical protein
MKHCIICREQKDEFSDEHVIPEGIGGYYHVYNVCKSCNNHLGTKIDSKLVDHLLSKFFRFNNKIKGKSKRLPNPLSGTYSSPESHNIRVQYLADERNNLVPYVLPTPPIIKDIDEDRVEITFTVDESDIPNGEQMIRKVLERNNFDVQNYQVSMETKQIDLSTVAVPIEIDTSQFRLCFIKIAYEFANDIIDNYYLDQEALEISMTLHSANHAEAKKYFFGSGFDSDTLGDFKQFINTNETDHYLVITCIKGVGLICFICLFNTFGAAIKLSNNDRYLTSPIFGVNFTNRNKFEIINSQDIAKKWLATNLHVNI